MWERYKMKIFDARERVKEKPLWTYFAKFLAIILFIVDIFWLVFAGFNILQIALILFGVLLFVISSRFKDEIEYEEMPLEITFFDDRISFFWPDYNPTNDGFEQSCCNTFLYSNITNVFYYKKKNILAVHGHANFDITKDDGIQKFYVKEYRKNIGIEIRLNFVNTEELLTSFDQYVPVTIEEK